MFSVVTTLKQPVVNAHSVILLLLTIIVDRWSGDDKVISKDAYVQSHVYSKAIFYW